MFWPIKRCSRDTEFKGPAHSEMVVAGERLLSVPPTGTRPLEVGVLVDATGSGAAFANGVPLAVRVILTEVEQRVGRLSVFVQTHRDEDYDECPRIVCRDADAREASKAVASIEYSGGGDAAETHLSAFESSYRCFGEQSRHAAGRRVMLALVNDDTKPARSGRTPEELGLAARQLGLLVYLICEPTRSLGTFAEAAGGMVVPISNNPSEELMQSIARRIAGSVTHSVTMRSLTPIEAPASSGGVLRRPERGKP